MNDDQMAPDPLASLDPPRWAVRRGAPLGVLGSMVVVMGMMVVVESARARGAAYTVLDVRMTTTVMASPLSTSAGGASGESWSVAEPGVVREAPISASGPAGRPDYYVRDRSGAWSHIAYVSRGTSGDWRRGAAPDGAPTSVLTERDVDRLFLRLRRQANRKDVSLVALDNRMAATFTTHALTWPFRYSGLARVWVDDITGEPRQIRIRGAFGASTGAVTVLTKIDSIRTISTATLPDDFFAPPDARPSPWDRLARWLHK